jgi:hypothetical protein
VLIEAIQSLRVFHGEDNFMATRGRTVVGVLASSAALLAGATAAQAVIGSDEGGNDAYRFVAQVQVGEHPRARGCSGALIAPQWVVTAKECFRDLPAYGPRGDAVNGVPPVAVNVTVGRTDLRSATSGWQVRGTYLIVHPERDVALVRLPGRLFGQPIIQVRASAPQVGDEVRLLGFGRTAGEWVPYRLHGAPVTVGEVGTSTYEVGGADPDRAAVCMGDAGGPAVRISGDTVELVGLHHASGQKGCLGAPADATTAMAETRLDDIAGWLAASTVSTCNTSGSSVGADQGGVTSTMPDWNGDCSADIVINNTAGELYAWRGTGTLPGLFTTPRRTVGSGWQQAARPRILSGDFNGDGRTDIVANPANGELRAWPSTGDLSGDRLLFPGDGILVGTGFGPSAFDKLITGDVDGDGRTDLVGRHVDGRLRTYRSTGDMSADAKLFTGPVDTGAFLFPPAAAQRLLIADVDGDLRGDLIVQKTEGDLIALRSLGFAPRRPLWQTPGVLIGTGWRPVGVPLILSGDANGDGKADIGARYAAGQIRWFLSTGDLSADGKLLTGQTSLVTGSFPAAAYPRILIGDVNNDGRADMVLQAADGRLLAYPSTGDGSGDGKLFPGPPPMVGTGFTTATHPRIF